MIDLFLIGIGTGNPDHVTQQAIAEMNRSDLILIPCKGDEKSDLADVRRTICDAFLTNADATIVEFDLPVRDASNPSYESRVHDWHDAIANAWVREIETHLGDGQRVALLVWGDPSLYDSTLRIASRLNRSEAMVRVNVVPGITSLQALTAAHAIPLNDIGAPVLITTGRRLRSEGWPSDVDTAVVMLDSDHAFETLEQTEFEMFWGAYLGMEQQITCAGRLSDIAADVRAMRAKAREQNGWIMDTYLLRRVRSDAEVVT